MAKYSILYEAYLGFSCFGGSISNTIVTEVSLSDEEVDSLMKHMARYNLSELVNIESDEINELTFNGEVIDLDTELPEIYDKIWSANLEGYCKVNLNQDLDVYATLPNVLVRRALFAQRKTSVFYHGSGVAFNKFDLSHALEGDGKCKFGFGVYLTSKFKSAAHYSASNPTWDKHYVYTVEVPEVTTDNSIHFQQPVSPFIVERISEILGESIPEKSTLTGKDFRKYLASILYKRIVKECKAKEIPAPDKIEGEKAASSLLLKAGIEYIVWPYNWRNPDEAINIAVLDSEKIRILCRHYVELDDKKKLVAKWKA